MSDNSIRWSSTLSIDEYRQSIDDLVRRTAQNYAEAGRDLSGRDPFLFNPFELRSGRLTQALEKIAQATLTPDLEEAPSEQKRYIRELIQSVYQYLFGPRYLPPHASIFLLDQAFQREPIGQLLNTVRVRLSPNEELLSVSRAAELLGIGRSEGYEWTQSGIFHPVSVSRESGTLQRIELWEVQLIAKERGIALHKPETSEKPEK